MFSLSYTIFCSVLIEGKWFKDFPTRQSVGHREELTECLFVSSMSAFLCVSAFLADADLGCVSGSYSPV